MASFAELVREHLSLRSEQTAHLQRLIRSWGLLADLSFSDVLLFAPDQRRQREVDPARSRPPHDRADDLSHRPRRRTVRSSERPAVNEAFESGKICDDSLQLIGLDKVRVKAVPVRHRGTTVAVLTRESLPVLGRSTSDLERTYLALFERFARMIAAGEFPFGREQDDQYRIPRVGDGIVVLDAQMRVNSIPRMRCRRCTGWGCTSTRKVSRQASSVSTTGSFTRPARTRRIDIRRARRGPRPDRRRQLHPAARQAQGDRRG